LVAAIEAFATNQNHLAVLQRFDQEVGLIVNQTSIDAHRLLCRLDFGCRKNFNMLPPIEVLISSMIIGTSAGCANRWVNSIKRLS